MIAYTFHIPDFWVGVIVGVLASFATVLVLAYHFRDSR